MKVFNMLLRTTHLKDELKKKIMFCFTIIIHIISNIIATRVMSTITILGLTSIPKAPQQLSVLAFFPYWSCGHYWRAFYLVFAYSTYNLHNLSSKFFISQLLLSFPIEKFPLQARTSLVPLQPSPKLYQEHRFVSFFN